VNADHSDLGSYFRKRHQTRDAASAARRAALSRRARWAQIVPRLVRAFGLLVAAMGAVLLALALFDAEELFRAIEILSASG
jgi:hypothetical protein